MMSADNRNRYDALIEVVREHVTSGKMPNPEWVEEIAAVRERNPDWLKQTPPSPPENALVVFPPPPPPPSTPRASTSLKEGRVLITLVDNDTEQVMLDVLKVLGARFCVFQNGGNLFELQTDPGKNVKFLVRELHAPRMVPIGATRAWSIAGAHCRFGIEKIDKGAPKIEKQPTPTWLGSSLVVRSSFPYIPVFSGLAQAPTLRSDGALIWEAGYDVSTGIFLSTDISVKIPEAPTKEDAQASLTRILDLVTDFDFVNEAGKSVWLSGLLSIVCRHTFEGPAPIFIIDASKRGSGKTMLADLASIIATGNRAPKMFYTHDNIEMDKRISSLAIAGDAMVLIDNVVGKLASPPLDAALTSTTYRGRVLGKTEMTPSSLPMKSVWFATGNGLIVGADTARRALFARLQPTVDRPEERTGPRPGETWKYPDPLAYAKANRAALLSDCLTVVAAFIRAGRIVPDYAPMGSFEAWSSTIRAAIVWAGGKDPCETIKEARAADLDELALKSLIECWPTTDPLSAADLIERANISMLDSSNPSKKVWHNALLGWLPAKPGSTLPTARDLGYALRGIKDAIIGNFRIEGATEKNGILWKRVRISADILEFEPKNKENDLVSSQPSPPVGVMG